MSAPQQTIARQPSNRGADPSSGAERNPQTQGEDAWSPHPAVCASGTWRLR